MQIFIILKMTGRRGYASGKERNMQPIYAAVKKAFTLAMILTLLFPVGGVLLGVGLAIGQPAMWAIGIACLACAFYGCPIGWVSYSGKKEYVRLVDAIEKEHLYTVSELAAQLGLSEKDVRNKIDVLFKKQYITGYRRQADGIALNENKALEEREFTRECPACGAKVTFRGTETVCPYCGTRISRE